MASFVESATLLVKDKSTDEIKQINRALRELFKTAGKLRSVKASITISGTTPDRINATAAALRSLAAAQTRVRNSSFRLNVAGIADVQRASTAVANLNGILATRRGRRALIGADDISRLRTLTTVARNAGNALNMLGTKGPSAGLNAIASLVAKIRRDAQAAQRSFAAIGRANVQGPPAGGGRGGGGGVVGGGPLGPRSVPLDYRSFESAWKTTFMYTLAATIQHAVARGFIEGYRDRDIADTRIGGLNLSPEDQAIFDRRTADLASRSIGFNLGQVRGLASEISTNVGLDPERTVQMVEHVLLPIIEMQRSLGALNPEEDAFNFIKAAESIGQFADATGKLDLQKMIAFRDEIFALMRLEGRDITATFFRDTIRQLQAARTSLDPIGRAIAILGAVDVGSRFATGINQLMTQLSGARLERKRIANLEAAGLIQTRPVPGTRESVEVVGVTDQETLFTNPTEWVQKHLVPAAEKLFGLTAEEIADPANARMIAQKFTSDRTATGVLQEALTQYAEIMKLIEAIPQVSGADQQAIMAESGLVAFQAVWSEAKGLFGEIANSLEGVFIPALRSTAGALNDLAAFVSGPEGEGDARRGVAVAGGAAVAGLAAFQGGRWLFGKLNPFTAPANTMQVAANTMLAAANRMAGRSAVGGVGGVGGEGGRRGRGGVGGVRLGLNALSLGTLAVTAGSVDIAGDDQGRSFFADQAARDAETSKAINSFFRNIIGDKAADILFNEGEKTGIAAKIDQVFNALDAALDRLVQNAFFKETAKPAPVTPTEVSDQTQSLRDEIKSLEQKIIDTRAAEKLPGTADPIVAQLETQKLALEQQLMQWEANVAAGAIELKQSVTDGGIAAADKLNSQAPTIGQNMGQAFSSLMPGLGASMGREFGQAAASIIQNIRFNVPVVNNPSGVNTGVLNPTE